MKKVFLAFLVFFSISYSEIPVCMPWRGWCLISGYRIGGEVPNIPEHADVALVTDILNNYLKENQKIKFIGYTDSTEVRDKKKLSYKRAEELYELMRFYGLREDVKVEILGRSDEKPWSTNSSAEGRYQNRRVEIILKEDFEIK